MIRTSWPWWQIALKEEGASTTASWRSWWDTSTYRMFPCRVVKLDQTQHSLPVNSTLLPPQLHRRLLYDDVRGVAEPLNETSAIFPEGLVVRGRLLLSLDRPASAADTHRPLAQEVVLQPLLTFTDGDLHTNTRLEVSEKELGEIFLLLANVDMCNNQNSLVQCVFIITLSSAVNTRGDLCWRSVCCLFSVFVL